MATQTNLIRSFRPNVAMSAGMRVTVSVNGYINIAGVDVLGIGIVQEDCTASSYETVPVRLWGTGTHRVILTGASATAGDRLVAVTNGLVAITNGLVGNTGVVVGMMVDPANANGGTTFATNPTIEVAFQG